MTSFRIGPVAYADIPQQQVLSALVAQVERIGEEIPVEISDANIDMAIEALCRRLNDYAHREGAYYFGTLDGSGTALGFWSVYG